MDESTMGGSLHTLSPLEALQLSSAAHSARVMGWIGPSDELRATRSNGRITVRLLKKGRSHERTYLGGDGWVFDVLRDLSQRACSEEAPFSPVACEARSAPD